MALPNIFNKAVSDKLIERIKKLTPSTQPLWGKMSVDQMLAHSNVTYEMIYDNIHPKPNPVIRFILKKLVKKKVVDETPYAKNIITAPQFIMTSTKDFDKEKLRLIQYIQQTQALGESHFDQKESLSFGALTITEWNNMLYKHLDHHLSQFGV